MKIVGVINYWERNRNFKLIWLDNGRFLRRCLLRKLNLCRKSLIKFGGIIVKKCLKFGIKFEQGYICTF
jgi:hypothetical protein